MRRRASRHLKSACDGAHFGDFATQHVWRYAANLYATSASTGIGSEAKQGRTLTPKRMDNLLIVVGDLEAVKVFFIELGS